MIKKLNFEILTYDKLWQHTDTDSPKIEHHFSAIKHVFAMNKIIIMAFFNIRKN